MSGVRGGLNVLLLVEASGGGSGIHVADLALQLQLLGHEGHVAYSPKRADDRFLKSIQEAVDHGCKITILPMEREIGRHDLAGWKAVRRFLKEHGPFDVIHLHSSKAGALGRLAKLGHKHKVVYTPHMFRTMGPGLSPKSYQLFSKIEKFLDRFSHKTICVSESERQHALSFGIPENKLAVVYNGIRMMPFGDRRALRQKLGVSEETVVFGTIARMAPQKAPGHLVKSFLALQSQTPHHLVFVGDGELFEETKALAEGNPNVTFLGHANGWEWLAAMDVFVLASHSEGFAYTPIEAAGNAKPCIVTATGGNTEIVDDGVEGLVVPVDDQPALVAAMQKLLESPDLRLKMGEAALERSKEFTVEVMAERIVSIYNDLLASR